MATTNEFSITMTAGEAIPAYRRVREGATAGQVLLADAADGDNWIGVSTEGVASGDPIAVQLRSPHRTYKVETSGAVVKGALLFPTDDGKVDDAVTTQAPCGEARSATAAAGQITELMPIQTAGDVVLLRGSVSASGDTVIQKPARKLLICDWWLISRDTGAANIKLKRNSTDASAVVAKGTTNDAIVRGGTLVAAEDEVAATDVLNANASASQAADVFVLCRIIG